jgi:hypothetical protein
MLKFDRHISHGLLEIKDLIEGPYLTYVTAANHRAGRPCFVEVGKTELSDGSSVVIYEKGKLSVGKTVLDSTTMLCDVTLDHNNSARTVESKMVLVEKIDTDEEATIRKYDSIIYHCKRKTLSAVVNLNVEKPNELSTS